jgi:hypothetical protein
LAGAECQLAAASSSLEEAQRAAAAAADAAADAAAARLAAALSLERLEGLVQCQICFEATRDTLLMPCMHFLYCKDCIHRCLGAGRPKHCPACRSPVSGQIVVHLNRE